MSSGWENLVSRLTVAFTEQVIEAILRTSLAQVLEALHEEDGIAKGGSRAPERLRQAVEASLSKHHWNVSAVAREMGKGRTQVRRWIERFELDEGGSGSIGERAEGLEIEHASISTAARAMDKKRRRARRMLEQLGYV
jgi:hypothetical protein